MSINALEPGVSEQCLTWRVVRRAASRRAGAERDQEVCIGRKWTKTMGKNIEAMQRLDAEVALVHVLPKGNGSAPEAN